MSGTENTDGLGVWTVVTPKGAQPVLVERRRSSSPSLFDILVSQSDPTRIGSWTYVASVMPGGVDLFRDGEFMGSDNSAHGAVMDLISGGPDSEHEVWPVLEVLPPGSPSKGQAVIMATQFETQRAVQIVRDTVKTFVGVLSSRELDRRLRGSEVPAVKSVVGTGAEKAIRDALATICVEVGNMIIARLDRSASPPPNPTVAP